MIKKNNKNKNKNKNQKQKQKQKSNIVLCFIINLRFVSIFYFFRTLQSDLLKKK